MRRASLIWLVLVLLAAGALFHLKFRVQTLEAEFVALNRKLLASQEAVHVLAAEWSYLNRPARLARLTRKYLRLRPVDPRQIVDWDEIPSRTARMPDAVLGDAIGGATPPRRQR